MIKMENVFDYVGIKNVLELCGCSSFEEFEVSYFQCRDILQKAGYNMTHIEKIVKNLSAEMITL